MKRPRNRKGFTLTELMISMTILAFVGVATFQIASEGAFDLFISREKLQINHDVRYLTSLLSEDAIDANEFYIYSSFDSADRDSAADRMGPGMSGDALLLAYIRRYPDPTTGELYYTGYTVYYRDETDGDRGPVYRVDNEFSVGSYIAIADTDAEGLISGVSPSSGHRQIVELAAGNSNGKLFFNYNNTSIIVRAEIIHGNAAKFVTDTYNFTISPRN